MSPCSDFAPAPCLARAHDTSCALALTQVELAGLHIRKVHVLSGPPPLPRIHKNILNSRVCANLVPTGYRGTLLQVATPPPPLPITHAAGHRAPAANHACPMLALSCRSVRLCRGGQWLAGLSLGRGAHAPAVQTQTGARSREPRRLQAFVVCLAYAAKAGPQARPFL